MFSKNSLIRIICATLLYSRIIACISICVPNEQYTESSIKFALDLYKTFIVSLQRNMFFSLTSYQTILSMVAFGSNGNTSETILKSIHFGNILRCQLPFLFDCLKKSIQNLNGLKIANKIYVSENYTFKEIFSKHAASNFGSELETIDFSQFKEAALAINEWILEKTGNNLTIFKEKLYENLQILFVSTTKFQGIWQYEFDPKETEYYAQFYMNDVDDTHVNLMNILEFFKFKVFDDLEATILEMPYKEENLSMIFILPHDISGLEAVENRMNESFFTNIFRELEDPKNFQKVKVALPQIKIVFKIEVLNVLKNLGAQIKLSTKFEDMFEPVNLSEEHDEFNLFHDLSFEFKENGFEPAGKYQSRSGPGVPYMLMDHPFIFILKHSTNIIGVGRYIGLK